MDKDELCFTYFPKDYRWSHGMLLPLGGASWGRGEIGEIHRVGLKLRGRLGDDRAEPQSVSSFLSGIRGR